jgi:hypothetical protein
MITLEQLLEKVVIIENKLIKMEKEREEEKKKIKKLKEKLK